MQGGVVSQTLSVSDKGSGVSESAAGLDDSDQDGVVSRGAVHEGPH